MHPVAWEYLRGVQPSLVHSRACQPGLYTRRALARGGTVHTPSLFPSMTFRDATVRFRHDLCVGHLKK